MSRAKPAKLDLSTPLPEVGECLHNIQFAAAAVAKGFGASKPGSAVDILKGAVDQACFELQLVAADIESKAVNGDEGVAYYVLMGVIDRLGAASETAEILWKLYQVPHLGGRTQ